MSLKISFQMLLDDNRIKRNLQITVLVMFVFAIVIILKWSSLPPQLPLLYSLPRSTDQLVSPLFFLSLPFLSLTISVLHFYIASILYRKERLAAVILTGISTTASFLLLVTFLKIVFLVT